MNPFFFGTPDRRLFGIYQPPASASSGQRAAVFCYPFGDEYVYAHRAVRQLALRLSAAGFHTLRFDYFGTGDSAGDMIDASLHGWETDLELAIEELLSIAGLRQVTLIGLRLGAAIAARAAIRLPHAIETLALWDPVVSGQDYLASLGADRLGAGPQPDAATACDIGAFTLPRAMLAEMRSIDLTALLAAPPAPTYIVVTDPMPSHDALRQGASGRERVRIDFIEAPAPWTEAVATAGIVPGAVLQRISGWLA